jgi:uncharacterized circularly permuted ATP-grasp superfamily protein
MGYKAFLVGVNTHDLQYAESDAELMSVCLTQHGYEIIKPYKKERRSIFEAFEHMLDQCNENDTVIFYYSGHASSLSTKLEFVLDEAPPKINNRIEFTEITKDLKKCKASNKLIILDCCYAGSAYENLEQNVSDRYKILTASTPSKKTKEITELKAGFLTYYINQGLTSNIADIYVDQKITINTFYEYLQKAAEQYNVLNSEELAPSLYGDVGDNFELVQSFIPNLYDHAKNNFEVATSESGIEPTSNEDIIELLESLSIAQFQKLLLFYKVPRTVIPPAGAFGQQTIALFEYALQKEGEPCAQLLEVIYKVAPHLQRGE